MFTKKDFYGTPGSRYAMLGCSWILCSILGVVIMSLITGEAATAGRMRIALVIQDIMIFVIPALITALFITRRPADLLCVRKGVSLSTILTVAMIMIVSAPAMNIIIDANRSMHLPQFLAPVEQWMRQSEQSAASNLSLVTSGTSVGALIINVLIIGCLAGFAEEIFFRGALQRIMATSGISPHTAVWVGALVFSAAHMQFYGFIPRLLLGAFFGYLLWWSRSLWLPVFAHAFNNTLALILEWVRQRQGAENPLDASFSVHPSAGAWLLAILGAALAAIMIIVLRRRLLSSYSSQSSIDSAKE